MPPVVGVGLGVGAGVGLGVGAGVGDGDGDGVGEGDGAGEDVGLGVGAGDGVSVVAVSSAPHADNAKTPTEAVAAPRKRRRVTGAQAKPLLSTSDINYLSFRINCEVTAG
jgi:hypothetical protein